MSLMDAYGLSLVSVEIWGVMLAITSTGFIAGGILVGKYGLGKNPVKTLLLINIILW
jgi:DHA3 family multidrug efflux protein-like MFS transporter